jgi:hypothetical protein
VHEIYGDRVNNSECIGEPTKKVARKHRYIHDWWVWKIDSTMIWTNENEQQERIGKIWRGFRPALKLLKGQKELVGCEVGVHGAENAENILKELDIKKLYLVDPYIPYEQCGTAVVEDKIVTFKESSSKRLEEWEDKTFWIHKTSEEACKDIPDGSLDFVYIDGNHQYESVIEDIGFWDSKVKIGGLIAGHDYQMKNEVKRAVDEIYGERVSYGLCFLVKPGRPVYDWWIFKE